MVTIEPCSDLFLILINEHILILIILKKKY